MILLRNVDVCRDVALMSAAGEQLRAELDATQAQLKKSKCRLAYLEGVVP